MYLWAITAMILMPSTLMAQEEDKKDLEAHVEASIVSHYMWRGIDMEGVSLQPELGVSWKGLSLTAAGSTGFDKEDLQEIDVTLGYERWGFNIGVTPARRSQSSPPAWKGMDNSMKVEKARSPLVL